MSYKIKIENLMSLVHDGASGASEMVDLDPSVAALQNLAASVVLAAAAVCERLEALGASDAQD